MHILICSLLLTLDMLRPQARVLPMLCIHEHKQDVHVPTYLGQLP